MSFLWFHVFSGSFGSNEVKCYVSVQVTYLLDNDICKHTFPEYLISTIPNIYLDGGMCSNNYYELHQTKKQLVKLTKNNYQVIVDSMILTMDTRGTARRPWQEYCKPSVSQSA